MHKPFEGIRVLEWGIFYAGPGATAILCDLGAEVIKIEQPGVGDPARNGARYKGFGFKLPDGSGLTYAGANRGKKSITLNLKDPEGREIAYRLTAKSDIFFTNLKRSTVKKMLMDYGTLSKINPKLIYGSITGFGTRGPDADQGGFDFQGQGRAGMMYCFGEPGMPPLPGQFAFLDQATSIMASYQLSIALYMRERFGTGQEVDVSLLSTASYIMYYNYLVPLISGREVPRHDQANANALRNHYRCSDGKWIVHTQPPGGEDWQRTCRVLDLPGLENDPRFDTEPKRLENSPELVAIFNKIFLTRTRDEWIKQFTENDLVICAINTVTEAMNDPQMKANNYIVDYQHPDFGPMRIPGFPINFSQAEVSPSLQAPKLGEHTASILKDIGGYSDREIASFKQSGVI